MHLPESSRFKRKEWFTYSSSALCLLLLLANLSFGSRKTIVSAQDIKKQADDRTLIIPGQPPTPYPDFFAQDQVQAASQDAPNIEGGSKETEERTWVGGLYDKDNNFVCGFTYTDAGNLVGLTQAHCLTDANGVDRNIKQARFCFTNETSTEGQFINVTHTVVKREHFIDPQSAGNDLGYIFLQAEPTCDTEQIVIIKEGEENTFEAAQIDVSISGWGDSSQPHFGALWSGIVKLVESYSGCAQSSTQLCGQPGNAGIRPGDSGSDVVSEQKGTRRLIGSSSKFFPNTMNSIFTRLSGNRPFLYACNAYTDPTNNPSASRCSIVMGNRGPELTDDTGFVRAGYLLELNVLRNDSDPDEDPLHVHDFEYVDHTKTGWLTLYDNGDAVVVIQNPGTYQARIIVQDDKKLGKMSQLTIDVVDACVGQNLDCVTPTTPENPTPPTSTPTPEDDDPPPPTATWTPLPDTTQTPGGATVTWTPIQTPVPTIDRTKMPVENDVQLPLIDR